MNSFIYILTNKNNVLYIGVTSNLIKRIYEHKNETMNGFTSKYKTTKLVYYEQFTNINEAIEREKKLKNWHKKWKIDLITKFNKEWKDLYLEII